MTGLLWILVKKFLWSKNKNLDKLLEMFSRECTFIICEYTSTKEDDAEPALCESFVVKMI